MKTRNLRRALWLCLPIVVLAGALWFVKESRPIEIKLPARVSSFAMLQRLQEEVARHPRAPRVTIVEEFRTDRVTFQFDRRAGTLTYRFMSCSGPWCSGPGGRQLKNISDSSFRAATDEALRLCKRMHSAYTADILHKQLLAHGAKYDG